MDDKQDGKSEHWRRVSARVPVTPQTLDDLRDFKDGLNKDYEKAVRVLLDMVKRPGETYFECGHRLRKWLDKTPYEEE